ncbi:hypothetical protein PZBJ_15630 [Pantoea endophytica]|uniref:Transposase n=1 Tax=Pantoea endophytica TaxID=92488 RepID=A0ABX4SQM8_9GAMM|nr:hypothetical protein PZBJ_15630 [Pantoea endophytica]
MKTKATSLITKGCKDIVTNVFKTLGFWIPFHSASFYCQRNKRMTIAGILQICGEKLKNRSYYFYRKFRYPM